MLLELANARWKDEAVTTDIIPAGQERGTVHLTLSQIMSREWAELQDFERALLEEAERRGIAVSMISPPKHLGGISLAWEPA